MHLIKPKNLSFYIILLIVTSFSNENLNREYYKLINQANKDIYNTNFSNAKKNIIRAFNITDEPYYHDIYKLIYCNFKLNDSTDNIKLLNQLVIDKKINPKLLKHQLKRILTENEITNLEILAYKENNSVIRSELLELFDYDQQIRDYTECDKMKGGEIKTQCYKSKFAYRDSIDELNAKIFLDIIERNEIPSENKIGVYLRGTSLSYNQIFYILGIHFLQTNSKNEIFEIYSNGLEQNKFHPELFAAVNDFKFDNEKASYGKKLLSTTINNVANKRYKPFIHYTKSNMDSINNNRISIGIDSFRVFQKQVISDLLCKKDGDIIPIISFPRFTEYPPGLIKAAFEKEKMKMNSYEINSDLIYSECNCQNRVL